MRLMTRAAAVVAVIAVGLLGGVFGNDSTEVSNSMPTPDDLNVILKALKRRLDPASYQDLPLRSRIEEYVRKEFEEWANDLKNEQNPDYKTQMSVYNDFIAYKEFIAKHYDDYKERIEDQYEKDFQRDFRERPKIKNLEEYELEDYMVYRERNYRIEWASKHKDYRKLQKAIEKEDFYSKLADKWDFHTKLAREEKDRKKLYEFLAEFAEFKNEKDRDRFDRKLEDFDLKLEDNRKDINRFLEKRLNIPEVAFGKAVDKLQKKKKTAQRRRKVEKHVGGIRQEIEEQEDVE